MEWVYNQEIKSENGVTEMTIKYTLKPTRKRKYHRNSTMSKAEVMLIMILFHDSGYRCFIETVNDELKNIAQVEHALTISSSTYYGQLLPIACFPKSRASMYKGPLTHSLHCSEFVELTLNYRYIKRNKSFWEKQEIKGDYRK